MILPNRPTEAKLSFLLELKVFIPFTLCALIFCAAISAKTPMHPEPKFAAKLSAITTSLVVGDPFVLSFTALNNGSQPADPAISATKLLVNGIELPQSGMVFGNGPRRSNPVLKPGEKDEITIDMRSYFEQPGIYQIQWIGNTFKSNTISLKVNSDCLPNVAAQQSRYVGDWRGADESGQRWILQLGKVASSTDKLTGWLYHEDRFDRAATDLPFPAPNLTVTLKQNHPYAAVAFHDLSNKERGKGQAKLLARDKLLFWENLSVNADALDDVPYKLKFLKARVK